MRAVLIATAAICLIFWAVLAARGSSCLKPTTPLTDAEIDAIFQRTERGLGMSYTLRNFAREIERAHNIKEAK